jgi:hypothetical protein
MFFGIQLTQGKYFRMPRKSLLSPMRKLITTKYHEAKVDACKRAAEEQERGASDGMGVRTETESETRNGTGMSGWGGRNMHTLAPVNTIFPLTKISNTILGCTIR